MPGLRWDGTTAGSRRQSQIPIPILIPILILSSVSRSGGSGVDTWPADQPLGAVEGLDLSLITDMLMLSATSPWTVYVADRAQWTLCFVSPSVSPLLGWRQREMVGGSAWEGCHADDMGEVTKMVWEGERMGAHATVVCFRRLRRNCSYATVQATGRPLGARWYAWVELMLPDAPAAQPLPVRSLKP